MKWLQRFLLALVLVLLLWQVWQRFFVTEEKRIQRLITRMEQSVERGELLKLESAIAPGYADESGLNKSTLLAAVRAYRQQYELVDISVRELQIAVETEGREATAEFFARVVARMQGGAAESEEPDLHVRLWFRKSDEGWQMRRAECPDLKLE